AAGSRRLGRSSDTKLDQEAATDQRFPAASDPGRRIHRLDICCRFNTRCARHVPQSLRGLHVEHRCDSGLALALFRARLAAGPLPLFALRTGRASCLCRAEDANGPLDRRPDHDVAGGDGRSCRSVRSGLVGGGKQRAEIRDQGSVAFGAPVSRFLFPVPLFSASTTLRKQPALPGRKSNVSGIACRHAADSRYGNVHRGSPYAPGPSGELRGRHGSWPALPTSAGSLFPASPAWPNPPRKPPAKQSPNGLSIPGAATPHRPTSPLAVWQSALRGFVPPTEIKEWVPTLADGRL